MKKDYRGRSFKNLNLEDVDFSYAKIQGADFTNTVLRNANFTAVEAGLEFHWLIIIYLFSILFNIITGITSAITALIIYFPILLYKNNFNTENKILSILSITIVVIDVIIFLINVYNKGFISGLKQGFVFLSPFLALGLFFSEEIAKIGVSFFLGTAALSLVTVSLIASSLSNVIAVVTIDNIPKLINAIVSLFIVILTSFLLHKTQKINLDLLIPCLVISSISSILGSYIACETVKGASIFEWIRTLGLNFTTLGATSFRGAILTNANFKSSLLKSTNFRKADLTGCYWLGSQKLHTSLLEESYLADSKIRDLLTTGYLIQKNLDRQNLQGINLQGANLADASFIGADLSHAKLQDADLTRAKLVQTQLDGTDFTGATLTGAYIEDWNITTDTKFDGVRCEYVYMRLPTPDNPDPHRKPDNRQEVFADGEFGDFIKPIFDTLDLYHSQGVDPRAIAISFKQLAENHPEADLQIVGMEVRGEDKFLLRAKTAIAADKSQLSAEYFAMYNQLKALAEQEVQQLIAEKDNRIADLQNMVVTALQRPSFYAQTYQNQGDTIMPDSSKQVFNNNLQGAQFGGGLVNADTVNAGQIGGNITNYNPEQKQNLAQAAADIQQLLNQLSRTYPTTTTSEKMTVVAKAVDEIESNPTLKARVIGALKAAGTEAFKELIDNPLINILLASIDGWQDAE
ncbi:pentapeptide repeat-containing protein [Anabaena sp. CCY 9910]|uniref:pentapeptide repeat-containing protein n=1 Tax=Anabaena sp. CCY 9910 TaxID=3103870 RepID=UPI0039E19E2C